MPRPMMINPRKNFQNFLKSLCNARDNYSMAVRSEPFESAKSHFFDTSSWGAFCDVTLTSHEEVQVKGSGQGGRIRFTSAGLQYVFGIQGLSPIA